jgi:precorrin isomerase
MSEKPWIHELLKAPMTGSEIEERSFQIIDKEAGAHGFPPDQWEVARRLLHTTADFNILKDLCFSHDAISGGVSALRSGSHIYADSNMIRSGISMARLRAINQVYDKDRLRCHVADPDVAESARVNGLPRSLFALQKAKDVLDGSVALFGNAPVALLEMNRMIMEDGIRPSLVVGMPVGFVHVQESKEELLSLNIPHIVLKGRRGGSPLAVGVLHAICGLAQGGHGNRQGQ